MLSHTPVLLVMNSLNSDTYLREIITSSPFVSLHKNLPFNAGLMESAFMMFKMTDLEILR